MKKVIDDAWSEPLGHNKNYRINEWKTGHIKVDRRTLLLSVSKPLRRNLDGPIKISAENYFLSLEIFVSFLKNIMSLADNHRLQ